MNRLAVFAGFLFLAASVPAAALADDEAAEEQDPDAPDAVRCERISITGSRIRRTRVCMTNAQWAEQNDRTHGDADRLLDNRISSCAAPGVNPENPNGC